LIIENTIMENDVVILKFVFHEIQNDFVFFNLEKFFLMCHCAFGLYRL